MVKESGSARGYQEAEGKWESEQEQTDEPGTKYNSQGHAPDDFLPPVTPHLPNHHPVIHSN